MYSSKQTLLKQREYDMTYYLHVRNEHDPDLFIRFKMSGEVPNVPSGSTIMVKDKSGDIIFTDARVNFYHVTVQVGNTDVATAILEVLQSNQAEWGLAWPRAKTGGSPDERIWPM